MRTTIEISTAGAAVLVSLTVGAQGVATLRLAAAAR
jgi:hypothetical protein